MIIMQPEELARSPGQTRSQSPIQKRIPEFHLSAWNQLDRAGGSRKLPKVILATFGRRQASEKPRLSEIIVVQAPVKTDKGKLYTRDMGYYLEN